MFFSNSTDLFFTLGFVNTTVALEIFRFIAPTLNLTAGNMNKLPIITDEKKSSPIEERVKFNIQLAQIDWDSYETSWDFKWHPLI